MYYTIALLPDTASPASMIALPRQEPQILTLDHTLEVADDGQGHAAVAQQDAHLDVARASRLGQVGRGDEERLVIDDHGLGVEHGLTGLADLQRAWVIVDPWPALAGPALAPERVREGTDQVLALGGVVPCALDVDQDVDRQLGALSHALRQGVEDLRPVVVDEAAQPDAALGCAEQFVVDLAGVAREDAIHLQAREDKIGFALAGDDPVDGPQRCCRPARAHAECVQFVEGAGQRLGVLDAAEGSVHAGDAWRESQVAAFQRRDQLRAGVGWQVEQEVVHRVATPGVASVKKAASSRPSTGTTSARSR